MPAATFFSPFTVGSAALLTAVMICLFSGRANRLRKPRRVLTPFALALFIAMLAVLYWERTSRGNLPFVPVQTIKPDGDSYIAFQHGREFHLTASQFGRLKRHEERFARIETAFAVGWAGLMLAHCFLPGQIRRA